MGAVLMVGCGLLVALGLAAVVRWGACDVRPPWLTDPPDPPELGAKSAPRGADLHAGAPAREVILRYLWFLDVLVISGLGAGLLMAGPGGRLVMRLLAVTADGAAQGRLTDAEEVVGEITVGGTIGFVIFAGLFAGLATGAIFLLLRRWLPGGRLAGLAFGGLLLAVGATRVEPLRGDNPDFDIVGPGWLALVSFSAVVLLNGMMAAALAGRLSRALPLLSRRRRSMAAYAPLLLLVPAFPAPVLVAVVGAAVVGLSRIGAVRSALVSPTTTAAGRVAVIGVALASLPGFASTVADIAGRG